MKITRWIWDNILFVVTLALLAFIPLYPKKPLLDVINTWVYIRIEDFIVLFVLLLWVSLLVRKKITLQTPLTLPIIIFWIVGAVATIHGVLLIFPTLTGVHSHVAFLNYLRRIEYISVFFVAYSGMKDKRFIPYVIATLAITLICVIGYGFGQRYYSFPAYLTMNEELASGTPVTLSALSRIPSTFAGHYDLAAYLVLIIPILTSMIFGFRNYFTKALLLAIVGLGFVLLNMTVSRVSFAALLLSLMLLLIFQKRKLAVLSLTLMPIIFLIILSFAPGLLDRFGNTVKEIDVLVSSTTGEAMGHVKEVPKSYLDEKKISLKYAQGKSELTVDTEKDIKIATNSALLSLAGLPSNIDLVVESNTPTGENLPQGTGYVNLPLSPVIKKISYFFYQKASQDNATQSAVLAVYGDFLVKRAYAYDLSFTTRFQGEWPNALTAFERNILFGSGYGSISLAIDNNYLRILGEVGLLGFFSYFGIFLFTGIYIIKVLPEVQSPIVRSFVLGVAAGVFGLFLNAILIDVFEASKIAFVLWLLVGITLGILRLYERKPLDLYQEAIRVLTLPHAVIVYLCIVVIVLFSSLSNYYFVGDDYTWLRWAADCKTAVKECESVATRILQYFTDANGFFYRPGTKVYFLVMYSAFWLNQAMYHFVSIGLHLVVGILVYLLARKILKDAFLSALASLLFLILSGYSEAVFWISSTGYLFNAVFILLSLLFYISWKEKKNIIYFLLSLLSISLSLLFHEIGVVAPLLILLYEYTNSDFSKKIFTKIHMLLFSPILIYLILRFFAQSHWFSGDYSYNLVKLPYNVAGNMAGYFALELFGSASLPFYQGLRNILRENILLGAIASLIALFSFVMFYRFVIKKMTLYDRKIIIFGFLFFSITLLPFLGLGNITSRYSYLSSVGFIFIFVFFLKKMYEYLRLTNGRFIAFACVTVVLCIFSLIHLFQLQKISGDWRSAGEKSERFLVSLDRVYTKDPIEFYFVNTPISNGEAWVFPVGLPDALWFTFQKDYLSVHNALSLESALDQAVASSSAKVFEFQEDGGVTPVSKAQNGEIIRLYVQ